MSAAPAFGRAMWLLTRLRLLRLGNALNASFNRPLGGANRRTGTAPKKKNRWVVSLFVSLMMLFSFGNLARQGMVNLHAVLDPPPAPVRAQVHNGHYRAPQLEAPRAPFSGVLVRGIALEMVLLMLAAALLGMGNRELAQPDWDLEWLVTLPVGMRTLLWSRVAERSIANVTGVLIVFPACVVYAYLGGWGWWTLPIAAAASLALLLIAGLLRTLADTGLRMALPPMRLRGAQAVISITSLVPLYLSMSIGVRPDAFVFDWVRAVPEWALWTPPGMAAQAIAAPAAGALGAGLVLMLAEVGLVLLAGVKLLEWQLRAGIQAAGVRESGRQERRAAGGRGFLLRSPVHRRELTLLARDRNFLVQAVLLPIIVVLSQFLINGRLPALADFGAKPEVMAATAFGIGAYSLMFSAFQTLNTEGGALWILYTVPRSLEQVLREKARLWSTLALAYPLGVFAIGFYLNAGLDARTVSLAVIAAAGVPIYSVIAVSLGVFGCDPLAQEQSQKLRPTWVYLYMMLASLYSYAIFADEWWQKVVLMVLSTLLALALWQKARDELPYLLDPSASPPARVSTADGLIAAMMFFVLQGLALVVMFNVDREMTGTKTVIAFLFAGALTFGLIRYVYWRAKTSGVPAVFGPRAAHAAAWGVGAGIFAAALGVAYVNALPLLGPLKDLAKELPGMPKGAWLLGLAVCAAPVFEEFIFRGLIFGGLRRSMGAVPAVLASAGIFAIVHPPIAMAPVFGLGACAAIAYERTRLLLAPMLAHAVYNAVVIGYQLV